MKPTKLEWEDGIQCEDINCYGQHIWRDGNTLYYVDEEGGIAPQRVVYEFPLEPFQSPYQVFLSYLKSIT